MSAVNRLRPRLGDPVAIERRDLVVLASCPDFVVNCPSRYFKLFCYGLALPFVVETLGLGESIQQFVFADLRLCLFILLLAGRRRLPVLRLAGDRTSEVGEAASSDRSLTRCTLRRRLDKSDARRCSSIRSAGLNTLSTPIMVQWRSKELVTVWPKDVAQASSVWHA